MDIKILHLIEGARKAKGLAIVIDVFRAFSLACYAFDNGINKIIPVGDIDIAFTIKKKNPQYLLAGERDGKKPEGFDFGNSPFYLMTGDLKNKILIHTTSAGTQGLVNCKNADEIITGSFNNAGAIIKYIRTHNFSEISLICMGNSAKEPTIEDNLCAEYIKNSLLDIPSDYSQMFDSIRKERGDNFYNKEMSEHLPPEDFDLCTRLSVFNFIIKAEYSDVYENIELKKVDI